MQFETLPDEHWLATLDGVLYFQGLEERNVLYPVLTCEVPLS